MELRKRRPPAETEPLLAAAAAEPLARIRKDRERIESRLRPLLAHIEENLFDFQLNAQALKRQCGVRDNNLAVRFTAALGKSPYAYIRQRRMQTAGQLLTATRLPVWQIAELVGYARMDVFSRAFKRWSGVRPSDFRSPPANPGPAMARGENPKAGAIRPWPDVGEVRCHRLQIWLPVEIHHRLETALAWCNRGSGNGQRRLTERDVMIAALVEWLQATFPAGETSDSLRGSRR